MASERAPDLDKIIDRVRKMWAHAESAKEIGSLAEAQAFAEAVEKTLAAHKLSFSILSAQQKDAQDPLGENDVAPLQGMSRKSRKRVWWVEKLAGIIAKAHFCQMIPYTSNGDYVCVVGRQSDREVASYMIVVLSRLAIELCEQGYWKARYVAFKETGTYDTNNFKESFFQGFLDGLQQRYDDLKAKERASTGNGMALVLRRSMEEVEEHIRSSIATVKSKVPRRRSWESNETGYGAGRNAARAANLHGKAAGAGDQTKQIPKPIQQLGGGK